MPPNGAAGLETMPWFTPTIPYSSPSITRMRAAEVARVEVGDQPVLGVVGPAQRLLPRRRSAFTGATGPKISSFSRRASSGMSVSTVGG